MKKDTLLLWLFILAKFVLQYQLIHPLYDLHRDEFLHIDQGRHLAWGYLSVPPLTSWLSWLILAFGGSVFWVKFFPALFGALTIVVVWKIVEALNGGLFAKGLAATAVLFSVILRFNTLYQPNSGDIFFWTFFYLAVVRYIQSGQHKWLYAAAVVFAFGFLNKYNIVFLLLGLLPAVLLSRQRSVFTNKHLYISAIIGLLVISPNLGWQYQNNFPVFHHLGLLAEKQLVNVNRVDFLKDQFLFFIGQLFIIIAGFLSVWLYVPFRKFRVLFWGFLFTLFFFVYFKAKSYYAIGLYPVWLGFGAAYLERVLRHRTYWRVAAIAFPIIAFIPLLPIIFPLNSPQYIENNAQKFKALGLLRWEDGKDHALPQDFADMLGWRELAQKVDAAYTSIPDKAHTLVYCDNYGEAGAINFYSTYKNINAVTKSADYINWFSLQTPIRQVIIVKDSPLDMDREKQLFENVYKVGQIDNTYAREYKTEIYVLENPKTDINALLRNEIENERW